MWVSVTAAATTAEDAPALFFVHGAGMDHTVWVMPARYFARHGYRVLAVDLPVTESRKRPALDSVDAMADWIARLVETSAAHASEVTVVGHDMGSLVGMSLAARYPALIDRLVLLGTSAPMPVADVLLNAAEDNDHAAIDMANAESRAAKPTGCQ